MLLSNLQFDLSYTAAELAKLLARKTLLHNPAMLHELVIRCSTLGIENRESGSVRTGILPRAAQADVQR